MVSRDRGLINIFAVFSAALRREETRKKKTRDENQSKHLTSIAHRWRSEKKYEEKKSQ